MKYCQYHPVTPASWHCPRCHSELCDACTDESVNIDHRHCFECGGKLESLGSAYTAEPFWEHLKPIFQYPITTPVMTLIILVSVIGMALSFFPILGGLAAIISAGIFVKYSFRCLEETAGGNMVPPDISDAYSGGLLIIVKIWLLLIAMGVGAVFLASYVGVGLVSFLGAIVLLSIPAFLINFAMSDSILSAASPLNILRIITAVGLPYGLLIGLLMLMISSVSFLTYFVYTDWEWLTATIMSVVSNYYMVVMFHLMGYVVFQYQERLGFSAREELGLENEARSEPERIRAQISVLVKSGDYNKAQALYRRIIDRYRQDVTLQDEFFEFLVLTLRKAELKEFADDYLLFKVEKGHLDQLKRIYRQIRTLQPDFVPASGEVRYLIAQEFAAFGEYAMTVHLINGMHREHNDLPLLIKAYSLLEEALEGLNKQDLVESCRAFLKQLKSKAGMEFSLSPEAETTEQKPVY